MKRNEIDSVEGIVLSIVKKKKKIVHGTQTRKVWNPRIIPIYIFLVIEIILDNNIYMFTCVSEFLDICI